MLRAVPVSPGAGASQRKSNDHPRICRSRAALGADPDLNLDFELLLRANAEVLRYTYSAAGSNDRWLCGQCRGKAWKVHSYCVERFHLSAVYSPVAIGQNGLSE